MDETIEPTEAAVDGTVDGAESDVAAGPRPKAPPIDSRFLFVDVAAMRAKQLRRGARPRLDENDDAADVNARPQPLKAERVAIEEVRRGLVLYAVPEEPSGSGAAE